MNRNKQLAAAVAAILGTAVGAQSAFAAATNPPTLAQAAAPGVSFYIAGSSAAKNAVIGALQTNLCGGSSNALTITSVGNTNFLAVSCAPASGVAGADGNTYYTVYYRTEGGSVVGALPIVNNDAVQQLNLNAAGITCGTANACSATVLGATQTNGIDDSFSGAVTNQFVQMGIMDVEPAALVGNNYPSAYLTSVWGPVNPAGLSNLTGSPLFGEVYGIFVNTGSATGFTTPLNLSKDTVANILTKKITNWSVVTDVSGNLVHPASLAIQIVNREAGSGSRAATDLLITGDTCGTQGSAIKETKATNVDYFSTGDVLNAANSVAGAITYATIDQSKANLSIVNLDGVTPSSLAAATGAYPFWVEATFATNSNQALSAGQTALLGFITTTLQAVATAPHLADIVAIPGVAGNTAHASVAANGSAVPALGTATIYVNPFTRGQVTCAYPGYVATAQ